MLTLLFYERARKVDLEEIRTLCEFFRCDVGEFLELVPNPYPDPDPDTGERARAS